MYAISTGVLALSGLIRQYHELPDLFQCHRLQVSTPHGAVHKYQSPDISKCVGCNRLLYIGDSAARNIFWATTRKLNAQTSAELEFAVDKHANIDFQEDCTQIEFKWDPYLNSSLPLYLSHDNIRNEGSSHRSIAMLVSSGYWHARHGGVTFDDLYDSTISSFVGDYTATDLTYNLKQHDLPHLLFSPVLFPNYTALSQERAATLTMRRLETLNNILRNAEKTRGISVLHSYSALVDGKENVLDQKGLHVTSETATRQADIFLNLICNHELQQYPFDKTTCASPSIGRMQLVLLIPACLCIGLAMWPFQNSSRYRQPHLVMPMAMALLYCYLADRTTAFERAEKTTDTGKFVVISVATLLMGIIDAILHGRKEERTDEKIGVADFMSREQTDEWKGLMQAIILLYHYFSMSKILWVYQLIRLMVGSYLFMTGYGHAKSMIKTPDFSFHRMASTLVRLNILSILLAYTMRTDYDVYYFPMLVSYWYVLVYIMVGLPHMHSLRMSAEPDILRRTKVALAYVLSSNLIAVIMLVPFKGRSGTVLPTKPFQMLHSWTGLNINAHEFNFRVGLDGFTPIFGVVCALCHNLWEAEGSLKKLKATFRSCYLRYVIVVSAVIIIAWYIHFMSHFTSKIDSNRHHTFLSPFVILAYLTLRNATPALQRIHSPLFARLGRMSLETFILQYHIWLAGDTKQLLQLGVLGRKVWRPVLIEPGVAEPPRPAWAIWLEVLFLTWVFLALSEKVAKATGALTSLIVGPKPAGRPGLPISGLEKQKTVGWTSLGPKSRMLILLLVLWAMNMLYK